MLTTRGPHRGEDLERESPESIEDNQRGVTCGVDALDGVPNAMARCDANWSLAQRPFLPGIRAPFLEKHEQLYTTITGLRAPRFGIDRRSKAR